MNFIRSVIFSICLIAVGCGSSNKFVRVEPPPDDRRPVPEPMERDISIAADNVSKIFVERTKRIFDLSGYVRKIGGNPREAFNIDSFDEVYDSSWFTNRNAGKTLTPEEIARGPNVGTGPDTSGVWTIFSAKAEGVTPGFSIRDSRGDAYLIKFDPSGYLEMATGPEVVTSRLFHAAGYNVPENYVTFFSPKILRLDEEVKFTDKRGKKRFMTKDDLDEILTRVEQMPDGRIRAAASKYLPGSPIGPFKYLGVRKDDFNDVIPHQHRRELRGLKVMAAWLNHYDTKANNSLDMYDPEGYVRHYLIDFGSTLGSQGDEPMPPEIGREGITQTGQTLKLIGSLGIHRRPWEKQPEIKYPGIGYFTSEDFNPRAYVYILPNPAFLNATLRDEYWGAKLVMSFSEEQIRAAVAEGQYSDPDAADYLVQTLLERQKIVGQTWFDKISTLETFELVEKGSGSQVLTFQDLLIETGLGNAQEIKYSYDLWVNKRMIYSRKPLNSTKAISLLDLNLLFKSDTNSSSEQILEIEIYQQRGEQIKSVTVYLDFIEPTQTFQLIAVKRD